MAKLSQAERDRVIALIQEGKPLPVKYRSALFADDDAEYVEATKDYRLVYKGKIPKEAVLRTTPAAPLQRIRSFNADNPFDDNWRNMLIFGDNLLALKALYNDQQGRGTLLIQDACKDRGLPPPEWTSGRNEGVRLIFKLLRLSHGKLLKGCRLRWKSAP